MVDPAAVMRPEPRGLEVRRFHLAELPPRELLFAAASAQVLWLEQAQAQTAAELVAHPEVRRHLALPKGEA